MKNAVAFALALSLNSADAQMPPPSNITDLTRGAFPSGVFNVPVIRVRFETTELGLRTDVAASSERKSSSAYSRTYGSESESTRTSREEVVFAAKQQMAASVGLSGGGLTGTGNASASMDSSFNRTTVNNLVRKDTGKSTSEASLTITEAEKRSLGTDAGYVRSTLVFSNLTNAAGVLRDVTVTLKWRDPKSNRQGALAAWKVCGREGSAIAVSRAASAVAGTQGNAGRCEILVPPYDPVQPEISRPVIYTDIPTSEVLDTLAGRELYFEVDPLQVVVGADETGFQTVIDAELRRNAVGVVLIDKDGALTLRYARRQASANRLEDVLKRVFGESMIVGGTPKEVEQIGGVRSRAGANFESSPETFKSAELEEGKWVIDPATGLRLDDPVPPNTTVTIAYITKRDRLSKLDRSERFSIFAGNVESERPQWIEAASCSGTHPGRRVVTGDVATTEFRTDVAPIEVVQTDFTRLPAAPDLNAAINERFKYREFYANVGATEAIASTDVSKMRPLLSESWDDYGFSVRFNPHSEPMRLSILAGHPGVKISRTTDGVVKIVVPISSDLLFRGVGEVCLFHSTVFSEEKPTGRQFDAKRIQAMAGDRTVAVVPGSPPPPWFGVDQWG